VTNPLFVVSSDLFFALDSIPAIIVITLDPFIVLTSNVFAIMELRLLYFLSAGVIGVFSYLKGGISFILRFVGIKMILIMLGVQISIAVARGIILLSLLVAVAASLLAAKQSGTVVSREAA